LYFVVRSFIFINIYKLILYLIHYNIIKRLKYGYMWMIWNIQWNHKCRWTFILFIFFFIIFTIFFTNYNKIHSNITHNYLNVCVLFAFVYLNLLLNYKIKILINFSLNLNLLNLNFFLGLMKCFKTLTCAHMFQILCYVTNE
jgi:hypothetical protein